MKALQIENITKAKQAKHLMLYLFKSPFSDARNHSRRLPEEPVSC